MREKFAFSPKMGKKKIGPLSKRADYCHPARRGAKTASQRPSRAAKIFSKIWEILAHGPSEGEDETSEGPKKSPVIKPAIFFFGPEWLVFHQLGARRCSAAPSERSEDSPNSERRTKIRRFLDRSEPPAARRPDISRKLTKKSTKTVQNKSSGPILNGFGRFLVNFHPAENSTPKSR